MTLLLVALVLPRSVAEVTNPAGGCSSIQGIQSPMITCSASASVTWAFSGLTRDDPLGSASRCKYGMYLHKSNENVLDTLSLHWSYQNDARSIAEGVKVEKLLLELIA